MTGLYFKQAWHMMRQNRLFSSIYIMGTALAIALTTTFTFFYFVKIAPIYPEYERPRTAVIKKAAVIGKKDGSWSGGNLSYSFVHDYLYGLKSVDKISAQTSIYRGTRSTSADGRRVNVQAKYTDPAFFDIYRLDFTQGKPFGQGEFESGLRVAAIDEDLAQLLLGGDAADAVGRTISLDFTDYTVCGVYKAGSAVLEDSFAEVIAPYTSRADYQGVPGSKNGPYTVVMTTDDINATKAEVKEIERLINSTDTVNEFHLYSQPDMHYVSVLKGDTYMNEDFSWVKFLLGNLPALLALLFVPALNLSGMIAGRMEMRQPELGVRKSFGATRSRLLNQVLWENLILTCMGGAVGLVILWIIMASWSELIFSQILGFYGVSATGAHMTAGMLFSPWVFLATFMICLLLNVLSALIPAWNSLKRPIINSLKDI